MRDLDEKHLITSDFILVNGCLVANIDLKPIIDLHKSKRLKNKNMIMTSIFRQAHQHHPSRSRREGQLYFLDSETNQILFYEPFQRGQHKRKVVTPSSVYNEHPQVSVHNDLIDCQIDICSPEVPPLFTENFDYQDVRLDFMRGILDSDILGKTIDSHILKTGYAASVTTQQMFHQIANDVMYRWTYPLVPENNTFTGTFYSHARGNIYLDKDVFVSLSSKPEKLVAIGQNSIIGSNCVIKSSSIGNGCKIDDNVIIENSHIFENAEIGRNCRINNCFIGKGAKVKDNVILHNGCLIGDNVIIGPDVELTECMHVVVQADILKGQDIFLGNNSNACVTDDFIDDGIEPGEPDFGLISIPADCPEFENFALLSDSSESDIASEEADDDWEHEVRQTIERSIQQNHGYENALIELNSLKMALNLTFGNLREVVFPVIFNQIGAEKKSGIKNMLNNWGGLIKKLIFNVDDQIELLYLAEQYFTEENEKFALMFFKQLYDDDHVEEDAILEWHASTESKLKKLIQPFVDWLNEADEESD